MKNNFVNKLALQYKQSKLLHDGFVWWLLLVDFLRLRIFFPSCFHHISYHTKGRGKFWRAFLHFTFFYSIWGWYFHCSIKPNQLQNSAAILQRKHPDVWKFRKFIFIIFTQSFRFPVTHLKILYNLKPAQVL